MMKIVKVFSCSTTFVFCFVVSVYAEGFLTLPIEVDVGLSCGFGCYPGHLGIDWPVLEGSYVVSPCNADVEIIQDNVPHYDFESGIMSFGNYIKLNAGIVNGRQVKIVLAHLLQNSFFVGLNAYVLQGQQLALSDNSGTTTGPHLHMTVYLDGVAVDPYNSANWLWTTNPPSHAGSHSLVGMFQDGWHNENYSLSSGRSQAFVKAYNEMGGQEKMGVPADNNGGGDL